MRRTLHHSDTVLSVVAGLLYCSWPLGYWLNPRVANHSLASGFEALDQPYNWLFVTTDIVSSLLLIIVCMLLWEKYRNSQSVRLIKVCLASFVLFAAGTIIDALTPEHCVPNLMRCASFTHDHFLLVHGVFSITASIFLFFGLCIVWLHRRRELVLVVMLLGYIIFGAISLIEALTPSQNSNWSENYYITLCSIWIALIPYAISQIANREFKYLSRPAD
ncbi:MAG: DUF998 domain-containing protein [Candidatus Saccharimonadales bacterium]